MKKTDESMPWFCSIIERACETDRVEGFEVIYKVINHEGKMDGQFVKSFKQEAVSALV